jgi:hypothetical protein
VSGIDWKEKADEYVEKHHAREDSLTKAILRVGFMGGVLAYAEYRADQMRAADAGTVLESRRALTEGAPVDPAGATAEKAGAGVGAVAARDCSGELAVAVGHVHLA